jgi:hypothetical protein
LGGTAITLYLAFHGGDRGGIAAFFFQYGVIAAFALLSALIVAIHWVRHLGGDPDQRKRIAKWILVAGLALVGFSILYPRVKEFLLVDKCLDSGGAWDAARSECRY